MQKNNCPDICPNFIEIIINYEQKRGRNINTERNAWVFWNSSSNTRFISDSPFLFSPLFLLFFGDFFGVFTILMWNLWIWSYLCVCWGLRDFGLKAFYIQQHFIRQQEVHPQSNVYEGNQSLIKGLKTFITFDDFWEEIYAKSIRIQ